MAVPRTGENRICSICKKEYYLPLWRSKRSNSRFCSRDCQNHKQYERFKYICKQCGKECESSPCRKGKKSFCSIACSETFQITRKECAREYRKNQIAKIRAEGKASKLGCAIRKYAFKQKEKKCELCGYMEFECCLDIHHADKNPNNNDLKNLMILCVMCHRKVHRKLIKLEGK